jgi:hypothetical protein
MTTTINQSSLINKQLIEEQRNQVNTHFPNLVNYLNDDATYTIEQTDFINIYNSGNGGAFYFYEGGKKLIIAYRFLLNFNFLNFLT